MNDKTKDYEIWPINVQQVADSKVFGFLSQTAISRET